jgi:hypothetical protein
MSMPRFLFERHPEIEIAHDWALAGFLTIDAPKESTPRAKRHRRTIDIIVAQLIMQMDALPAEGLTLGGEWPADAIDEDALRVWVAKSHAVMVRVAMTEDGTVSAEIRAVDEDDYADAPERTLTENQPCFRIANGDGLDISST